MLLSTSRFTATPSLTSNVSFCVLGYITILIGIGEVKRFIIIINGGISDVQREHICVILVSVNSISTVVEPIIFRIPIVINVSRAIVIAIGSMEVIEP